MNGDEWLLGIYDSMDLAYGAVMKASLKELDDISMNIDDSAERCIMTIDSMEDSFAAAYMEVNAHYSATSYNTDMETRYRIFYEPEGK
jgi:hypothetical protein